jgi:hypothetical protein
MTISTDPTVVDPQKYRAKVFKWARDMGLVQARIGIYQPKVIEGGVAEWVTSLDELEAFAVELEAAAQRVQQADASYRVIPIQKWFAENLNPNPGDEACDFCRAMATCPAVRAKLENATKMEFGAIPEDTKANRAEIARALSSMSEIDLNTAMNAVGLLEAWAKTTRAEVERRLMNGEKFADWGLELGRLGNREWQDEEAVEAMLRTQWRLPMEDVYHYKLKSPAQVEAMTKVKADSSDEPKIGDVRWQRLQKFISRADPKPSVKPRSVIKTPYNPKPDSSAFGAIIED